MPSSQLSSTQRKAISSNNFHKGLGKTVSGMRFRLYNLSSDCQTSGSTTPDSTGYQNDYQYVNISKKASPYHLIKINPPLKQTLTRIKLSRSEDRFYGSKQSLHNKALGSQSTHSNRLWMEHEIFRLTKMFGNNSCTLQADISNQDRQGREIIDTKIQKVGRMETNACLPTSDLFTTSTSQLQNTLTNELIHAALKSQPQHECSLETNELALDGMNIYRFSASTSLHEKHLFKFEDISHFNGSQLTSSSLKNRLRKCSAGHIASNCDEVDGEYERSPTSIHDKTNFGITHRSNLLREIKDQSQKFQSCSAVAPSDLVQHNLQKQVDRAKYIKICSYILCDHKSEL
ncbi:unnamed protein product [Protopolystoma xenopodis]|uniref:Uncharacterized protein n=1 Tax=Protopolystoma xenopodis TaxID=117903 RepID=A0A3S5CH72_9PLAT|nr:unnamed protein product [Protopolystoma xenopodis]